MADPHDYLITFEEVQSRLGGCVRQSVYNLMAHDPNFPKPVKLFRRKKLWRSSDIGAFIASQPDESGEEPGA